MKNKRHNLLAVCGLAAVMAIAKNDFAKINRLYFNKETSPQLGFVCKKLASQKIPYNCVEHDSELEKLSGSTHHQGVVAFIKSPSIQTVTEEKLSQWAKEKQTILCLDSVLNANNVGAIIRSASFFGIRNIVLTDEKIAVCTSAYRVAQGGMEFVNLFSTHNLPELVLQLKNHFICVGCDVHTTLDIKDFFSDPKEKPFFFILGNEENGISCQVKKECDVLVKIDGFTPHGKTNTQVESLNVAQAASIICYEARRQSFST
ncbi:MAG: TrmH family RNA methyltransferase [Treponemataceae bacterium]